MPTDDLVTQIAAILDAPCGCCGNLSPIPIQAKLRDCPNLAERIAAAIQAAAESVIPPALVSDVARVALRALRGEGP